MKFVTFLLQLCIVHVVSMPYHAPLQGIVGGKRTLVLMDDIESVPSYSQFFGDLTTRGHALSFLQAESSDLQLKSYGEMKYDNVIFFAPSTDRFSSITFDDLSEFSNEGGNIIVALNRDVSDNVRDFVESFGVALDKKGTEVIDHFNFNSALDTSLQHTHVLARNSIDSVPLLGAFAATGGAKQQPVLFHGIGQTVDDKNVLTAKVLTGNPSTYSAMPSKAAGDAAMDNQGTRSLLVSAVQGRNNARVVIAGSMDMFSNAYFQASSNTDATENTGNELFCSELSKWAFGEVGVLRFRDITHHRSDGVPPDVILHEKERPDLPLSLYPDPELTRNSLVYRIKDEITYSMIVEQFSDGAWKPFVADDVQMEFVMLDPYVRTTMTCDPESGKFTTLFTAPDSYGVFKFRVLYRRSGYSVLHAETQVSIRPFKHNEYERFIFSAYPYYSSAFSAAIAVFFFSVFFLFSTDGKK